MKNTTIARELSELHALAAAVARSDAEHDKKSAAIQAQFDAMLAAIPDNGLTKPEYTAISKAYTSAYFIKAKGRRADLSQEEADRIKAAARKAWSRRWALTGYAIPESETPEALRKKAARTAAKANKPTQPEPSAATTAQPEPSLAEALTVPKGNPNDVRTPTMQRIITALTSLDLEQLAAVARLVTTPEELAALTKPAAANKVGALTVPAPKSRTANKAA